MLRIGQKVKFDPFDSLTGFSSKDNRGKDATGTVIYINRPHKWFLVEHSTRRAKVRQAFKFSQIGKEVRLSNG